MNIDLENFDYTNINSYIDILVAFTISFIPTFIGALVVLYIGFKLSNFVAAKLEKYFEKAEFDPTIERFIVNIVKVGLKVLVLVAVVGILGVQTSSFVALFAAAGFALGGALSGTLGHFASGLVILGFRPFRVGDIVEIDGNTGTVTDINLFATKLKTVDTKIIVVPNNEAIGSSIINYSMQSERQIDLEVGIGYSDDIDYAREVLERIAKENPKSIIDEDHPVRVLVKSLGDNAVVLAYRLWTSVDDYWTLRFELTETIKKEFDKTDGKLNFPFPQRDIHHYYETAPLEAKNS